MGKVIKWLLILLGCLIGLIALALVFLVLFVDPNDYREEIQTAIKDATGMELVIEGDLKLDLFPWIAVDLGKTTLKNPEGFGEVPFASIQAASVGVRAMPLLSLSVEAGNVNVDGLVLNLIRLEDGTANWETLFSGKQPQDATQEEQTESDGSAGFSIGGVTMTKANILVDDRRLGTRYEIKDADITLGAITPGRPFDLTMALGLSSTEPEISADIVGTGVVAFDMKERIHSLSDLDVTVAATGKAVPSGETEAKVTAELIAANLADQTGEIRGMVITAYDIKARAEAVGTAIVDEPSFTGSLKVEPFDLRELMETMDQTPPETADPEVLRNVAMALGFDFTPGKLHTRDMRVMLDETPIDMTLSVLGKENPAIKFYAQLDEINLTRYLPPKKEKGAETEQQPAEAGEEKPFLTDATKKLLKSLNLDGQLKAGRIQADPTELNDLLVKLQAQNGIVRIEPASFSTFEGAFHSTASLDVRNPETVSAFKAKLRDLKIGELLVAFTGEESLSGDTNADMAITARGDTVSALKRSLSGDLSFKLRDGVFPGVDFAGVMSDSLDVLQSGDEDEVEQQEDAKTKFGLLQGTARITNGLINNDDFLLKSPFIQVDGKGTVNLPTDEVDYLIIGALLATTEGQGRGNKDDEFGISIPVRVRGTFTDLHYWPDPIEWAKIILNSGGRILGSGVETVEDLGQSLIDTVTGNSEEEPATGEATQPEEQKDDDSGGGVGETIKGLFQ